MITAIGIIMDAHGQTLEDVQKLKKALFVDQHYDAKMRPIKNQSNQIVVSLSCTFSNTITQELTLKQCIVLWNSKWV